MPRIIPIKELKDTAKISEMCHENEDPSHICDKKWLWRYGFNEHRKL